MTTLRIDDLCHSKTLDASAMDGISGGLDINSALRVINDTATSLVHIFQAELNNIWIRGVANAK